MKPKNLAEAPLAEQKRFLESFKYVLSDMDGVIWLNWQPISGAADCFTRLEEIGKKISFVTNNHLLGLKRTRSKLADLKFPAENVITPGTVIMDYLKRINFDRSVFVMSNPIFRVELAEAGFKVADEPLEFVTNIKDFLAAIQDDPEVGAVIFESDINLNRIKLQKAVSCLKRPDCLFLAGACDEALNMGVILIGNGHFYRLLCDFAGREAVILAKPSKDFAKIAMDKFDIKNTDDVLFIGDTIETDMGYAANVGFKKLLTLTGNATMDDIENWKYPEEFKPEYYVRTIADLKTVVENVYKPSKL